ncbi:MAG: 3-oxoacyl-[acyl-carrier-protein] synthase 3 protein 1 [Chlamydiae bacterium]|nr:3-oxoacyl-[acyl-carrier-protein] synthase 3 protein 1 [Chlamydiota bacterium]
MRARIIGTGRYLPKKVLTNKDFEKMVETTDEWIVSRTGIRERRIAADNEFTSTMGVEAAKKALESAHLKADDIDLILVATLTPDYIFPSVACLIQEALGAKCAAMDFQAACTGYLYGLAIAKGFIESKVYKNILLIASEKLSSIVDYEDRATCVLFGDGASACVISDKGDGFEILDCVLGADGSQSELIIQPAGGSKMPASAESVEKKLHTIKMEGRETFKHAVRRMVEACQECLEKNHIKEEEIDWMLTHQANDRIIEAVAKRFNIEDEKVYKTIHKYGNTSASSIGIAFDELIEEKTIDLEQHLLLTAFGSGLTWGATILKKVKQ